MYRRAGLMISLAIMGLVLDIIFPTHASTFIVEADTNSQKSVVRHLPTTRVSMAIMVTEVGPQATAGDTFTGIELSTALRETVGWSVELVPRKQWTRPRSSIRCILSLLETYQPPNDDRIVKVAWLRNQFDKWMSSPSILQSFDVLFTSSQRAAEAVSAVTGRTPHVLPIATNPVRFSLSESRFRDSCDVLLALHYWKERRDTMEWLDPAELPSQTTICIFGRGWARRAPPRLQPYLRGPLAYDSLPSVYARSRIVVDDANPSIRQYGSINSRVFDGLAAGALVVTNNKAGSEELFEGRLPVFTNASQLHHILNTYLLEETTRAALAHDLRQEVLAFHTYSQRAREVAEKILNVWWTRHEEEPRRLRFSLKVPAPQWDIVHEWGDYHMAEGLRRALERRGHHVVIQVLSEWNGDGDADCDIVVVFRGLSRYRPKSRHINFLWVISHPTKITDAELKEFDAIFAASPLWAECVRQRVNVPITVLLQCTDPVLFSPPPHHPNHTTPDLLFVGNSRNVFRRILRDLLPTKWDLAVYGSRWNQFPAVVPFLRGDHLAYDDLPLHYASCGILLNDHWDDMREWGFISNRIFDGLAAGAFLLTDRVQGIEDVFGGAVVTYEGREDLASLVEYYLAHTKQRSARVARGRKVVLEQHTFDHRAEVICTTALHLLHVT